MSIFELLYNYSNISLQMPVIFDWYSSIQEINVRLKNMILE